MIDMERNRVVRNNMDQPIQKWAVWFKTPFGLCERLDEAVEKLKSIDVSPDMAIVPVPVAITESSYEVVDR